MPLSRRTRWVLSGSLAALIAAALTLVAYRIPISSDRLRREVVATLSERLDAQVELAAIEVHPFPRVRIVGRGLVIHHRRHPDVALIAVDRFHVEGDLVGLLRKHVAHVTLEGLAISIPPGDRDGPDDRQPSRDGGTAAEAAQPRARQGELVLDDLVADGAVLRILPREAHKPPRTWQLHRLRVQHVGRLDPMPFQATLTNAIPPGDIDTAGTFGPWQADEPGLTPVAGDFTFDRADLSVFKGIAGILAAHGTYDGTLGRIEAEGETTTPDFMVSTAGHPMPLATTYRAVIDGTNGDTTLERVEARLLETTIVAVGGVYDVPDVKGRLVRLDVSIDGGRLADVLQLAVPTPQPTMTGRLDLQSHFELPPGDLSVVDKLRLDGAFNIADGRFTDQAVQQKINSLSGRARTTGPQPGRGVASTFTGRFRLGGGRLTLAPLTFDIPGATVELRGGYGLRSQQLAFAGQLRMQASVSQALDGWKSWLLKPFDPIFRKDGRTFIPLTIGGTRNDPKFGVDVKRIFNKDAPPRPPSPPPAGERSRVRRPRTPPAPPPATTPPTATVR